MQMMRHLSAHVPVLYVNSIGIRVPRVSEGRMFVRRVTRKLRSLARGFRRLDERRAVLSPFAVPGHRGRALTRAVLPAQIRRAMRRMGIERPLVWVTCPPAADFVRPLRPAGVVYQRTDRWEEFPHADRAEIQRCDRLMKAEADATLFCASLLFEEEGPGTANPVYIDHGVDYERFAEAGALRDAERDRSLPEDLSGLPRPLVGFIGGIDSHTFDPALFLEVAGRVDDANFFLVGACSLPEGWCELPNVYLLGQKPYERVAEYMAAADVLIMPWNQNEWIRACNPVKLKEYLAAGRPVVTTGFYELKHYPDVTRVADGASAFAGAVREAIAAPGDPERLRARVRAQTWDSKARALLDALASRGVRAVRDDR